MKVDEISFKKVSWFYQLWQFVHQQMMINPACILELAVESVSLGFIFIVFS